MAMVKSGYRDAYRGTTKAKLGYNAEGNIAQAGEVVEKTKYFSVNTVNTDNGLAENQEVINLFIQLAGGETDSLTNQMTVNWKVTG